LQALLLSITEKLIPALPFNFRVAAMQQTLEYSEEFKETTQPTVDATVLEYVTQSDAYRNRLLREYAGS
jgi:hypothetical protein